MLAVLLAGFALVLAQRQTGAHELGDTIISVDADPATAGVQSTKVIGVAGSIAVDVLAEDFGDLGAFNFQVVYDNAVLVAPTIASGPDVDRNPNANQTTLNNTGRTFACSPPSPSGDTDPSVSRGVAFISCHSTGGAAGPSAAHGAPIVLATVSFTIVNAAGGSPLRLENVNLFDSQGTLELASCDPIVSTPGTCENAAVSNLLGDTDGDGCPNLSELGSDPGVGGRRNYTNPWDFYDVNGDKVINVFDDVIPVAVAFGPSTGPSYSTAKDRSPPPPPGKDATDPDHNEPWDMGPPDSTINVFVDILGVAQQFGHDCA